MADENISEQPKVTKKFDIDELGVSGLRHQGGFVFEERLKQLDGIRGLKEFREMSDNDAIVGAMLFIIEALIKQVEWRVDPFDQSTEAITNQEFVKSNMDDMEHSWGDMISEALTMLIYGHAPMEQVFKVRQGPQPLQMDKPAEDRIASSKFNDGKIGWRKIVLRGQESVYQWKIANNGDIEGFLQVADPLFKQQFIPIEKLLLFRTTKRMNNPLGRSILRNAWRSWFFKKKIENIEAIGIERDLAGLPVATVPSEIMSIDADANSKAIYSKMKRIVTNIRRDEQEGVILPGDADENGNKLYDLKLLSTAGSRQFKTTEIVNRYDNRIAMTVAMDFILLGHEKVGSFSLGDSKTSFFTNALRAVLVIISDMFNRKAFSMLLRLNGMNVEKQPMLNFGDIETVDLTALGAYITQMSGIGVDLSGEKVQNYLKSQANLPLEETDGA